MGAILATGTESAQARERMKGTGKSKARAVRQHRLSVAMRENLKRRKAQARGRAVSAKADSRPRADQPAK
jgi:hypothetical protein